MTTKRLAVAVATLTAGALITGCGGGDDKGSRSAPGAGSVEEQLGFSQAGEPAAQASAEAHIAACMKAQGFQYTSVDPVARQAALTQVRDQRRGVRLAEIVGPLPAGESAPGEFAGLTPELPYDPAALARLRRLQLKFANADVTCEDEQISSVENVVQKEKERQFREDNAELLRRVKPGG